MMTKYQKFLRDNQVALQGLVGSFDDNDKYTIKKEIIEEIISAKKLLLIYREYEATCELYTKEKTYKLKFTFTVDEKSGKKYANLYLIENLELFGEKTELKTFLVCYSAIDDVEYLEKLKKVFNLITKDESEGKDIKNDVDFDKKAKQNAQKQKALSNQMWYMNKKYIYNTLKILKNSGDAGFDIIKLFNKSLSSLKMNKNSPEFWMKAKNILDEYMFKNQHKLPEKSQKLIDLLNNKYIEAFTINASSYVAPSDKGKGDSKKKSAGGKKGGGAKKSGDKGKGGGKKDTKKDTKKDAKKDAKKDSSKDSKKSGKESIKADIKSTPYESIKKEIYDYVSQNILGGIPSKKEEQDNFEDQKEQEVLSIKGMRSYITNDTIIKGKEENKKEKKWDKQTRENEGMGMEKFM